MRTILLELFDASPEFEAQIKKNYGVIVTHKKSGYAIFEGALENLANMVGTHWAGKSKGIQVVELEFK